MDLLKETKTKVAIHQMVLIGSAGRNCGKTTLACSLIDNWKELVPIYALKVISIDRAHETCHRGGDGCGMCSNLTGNYELIEETDAATEKDTSKLLAAGASKSYLLKTLRSRMAEGITAFLQQIPPNALIICESNSLRTAVEPGLFIFANSRQVKEMKPSAKKVYDLAGLEYLMEENDMQKPNLNKIKLDTGKEVRVYIA